MPEPVNIRSQLCGRVQQVTTRKVVLLFCDAHALEIDEVGNG